MILSTSKDGEIMSWSIPPPAASCKTTIGNDGCECNKACPRIDSQSQEKKCALTEDEHPRKGYFLFQRDFHFYESIVFTFSALISLQTYFSSSQIPPWKRVDANLAARGFCLRSARERVEKKQIDSMSQDGLEKMLKGITTWEEVVRASATG